MKITKIEIENYKSIRHLVIEPNQGINAFVGENSVGKSNIFNAVTWLLGPVFPSFNSTLPNEHWNGDENNKIKISLTYDDGNTLELAEEWFTSRRDLKSGLNFNSNYCTSETRENYCSAYLDLDRQIQDYLPSNRWTLIGRILQQINEDFKSEQNDHGELKSEILKNKLVEIRDDILFSVGRTSSTSRDGLMDKFLSILQKESALQLNRPESEFQIDLSLYDPWNFYRTLQLLVSEKDLDMPPLQASALGMGIQASISIAVLKAYSEIKIKNKTPIFIDEPELFLHPQAQRNFYNELVKIAEDKIDPETGKVFEGVQIFYNTHSPNFIRADRFNEVFVVRKNSASGTYLNHAKPKEFVTDLKYRKNITTTENDLLLHFKNAYENTGDSQNANEAFFARKVLLVEGQTESLVLPYFFNLLGYDYVKEGISIVRCGSKGELDRFFRLYNELGIPTYIIFDGDKNHEATESEAETIIKNRGIFELFGEQADWPDGNPTERYLGFETEIEDNLGFQATKDNAIDLFKKVKEKIVSKDDLPKWAQQLVLKLDSLNTPITSVLILEDPSLLDDNLPF
jgi:putative ATP-dependent endonuclease of OLD family